MNKRLILSATSGKNLELANNLESVAKELGEEVEVINLENLKLPLYEPTREKEGIPKMATELAEKLSSSLVCIWCAPEYNGSIPPILSNAIAWVSRSSNDDNWRSSFQHKVAVVGTHSGGGGAKAVLAMRMQLEHLGSIVHPLSLIHI